MFATVQQAMSKIAVEDIVLVVSLSYLCVDIQFEWEEFAKCARPINLWLFVSYVIIVLSRTVHVLGTIVQSGGNMENFLVNLRQRCFATRILVSLMWFVIAPAFTFWTLLGSSWFMTSRQETPSCVPDGVHFYFMIVWQVLSYVWIIIHASLGGIAGLMESKLQRAERDIRQVQDEDSRARWGVVGDFASYTALQGLSDMGLSVQEIQCLPCSIVLEPGVDDCSICLSGMKSGEGIRTLPTCGHSFHRSCIDLWLLRSTDCPLCKSKVKVGERAV